MTFSNHTPDESRESVEFEPIAQRLRAENERITPSPEFLERLRRDFHGADPEPEPAPAVIRTVPHRGWTWATAAAAMLVVALGALFMTRSTTGPGGTEIAADEEQSTSTVERVAVRFADDSPHFGVPIETQSPNVSIVMVYHDATRPTSVAAEPEAADQEGSDP